MPSDPGIDLQKRLENDENALIAILERQKKDAQTIASLTSEVARLGAEANDMMSFLVRAIHPFVDDRIIQPPVGTPIDFWDEAYAAASGLLSGETIEAVFERVKRDGLPIPSRENSEGYANPQVANSIFGYWLMGLNDYFKVWDAAKTHGVEIKRMLDFGGSTGRVFRHFYCQGNCDVWACDFNVSSVAWCFQNLPSDIRVFLNTVMPTLPLPSSHFDAITAFSVFTHIDQLETPWLLELKRVVKPGGILYLTIHDENTWANAEAEILVNAIRSSPNGATMELNMPMPQERLAFHYTESSHYNCVVFQRSDYIRKVWGRYFEIAEIIPRHHSGQAVVVCVNTKS